MTPIEALVEALVVGNITVSFVLVPEQCAMIHIGDKAYHVTIEEFKE